MISKTKGQVGKKERKVLEVKNLTTSLLIKKQKVKVVDSLSFDLKAGKTLALVGESGCGKSMTALSLLKILPQPPALPSEGKVIYQGRNLLELSEKEMREVRGAKISVIFQDPMSALNPVYTVGDQLVESVENHLSIYGSEAEELAVKALDEVGIPNPGERFFNYPHQLSGGMQQRVMIAIALICKPDILIADEPTTALDVTVQAQILELIRKLQEERGMALLLITHDMGVVAEMADEVVVMYATEAIEQGGVREVFSKMLHPYTQGLFQSLPSMHSNRKEKLYSIKGTVPPITDLPSGCHFSPRCPHAMEKCLKGSVPAFPLIKKGHWAKCWLREGR